MSILDKIFGGGKEAKEEKGSTAVLEVPPCPHTALVPHWDNVDDMGQKDKATSYICESCHESFTPAQVNMLRDTAAERIFGSEDTSSS